MAVTEILKYCIIIVDTFMDAKSIHNLVSVHAGAALLSAAEGRQRHPAGT